MVEKRYSEEEAAFFRDLCFAEEDRHRHTLAPWDGSFRWFKADNVICLEHYRRAPVWLQRDKPAA
jgi:hypothetical protein